MSLNPDSYDGVLLGVSFIDAVLLLRIDSDPVCRAPDATASVWEVRLTGAEPTADDFAVLRGAFGQHISWEVERDADGNKVAIYLRYGADPTLIVTVHEVHRSPAEYTPEDLRQKCYILASLFTERYHAAHHWQTRYQQLIVRMNNEIDKRIDREGRKVAFFESNDSARSQRWARSRDVYLDVRDLLKLIERELDLTR